MLEIVSLLGMVYCRPSAFKSIHDFRWLSCRPVYRGYARLGSVNGVAILLPVTFLVPPTSAIIFLAALYYGAMYGGAISSITLGIWASTAVATVFDGKPMARQGMADQALMAAAIASIGGTVSIVLFTLFAPPLANLALKFGPQEVALISWLCDVHWPRW